MLEKRGMISSPVFVWLDRVAETDGHLGRGIHIAYVGSFFLRGEFVPVLCHPSKKSTGLLVRYA